MNSTDSHLVRPSGFDISELDYDLPEALIAQHPAKERGSSRLLVVDRALKTIHDDRVENLPDHLRRGDTLVMNDTRVVPAKFRLKRATGGIIDALFLSESGNGEWEVLLKGAQRVSVGETLTIDNPVAGEELRLVAMARGDRGRWQLKLCAEHPEPASDVLNRVGRMPLPPYIKRQKGTDDRDADDRQRYQTIFADRPGAVAAPTAGLHFTQPLLDRIQHADITMTFVTLHVGYGTFAPVEVSNLADHRMHRESFEINRSTCENLTNTRRRSGRVVAVGTTSARVLESTWRINRHARCITGTTELFCYPPFEFGGFDALMTNFHLPKSTLMALVMAFGGVELIRQAYQHAIEKKYRFFSYGDAMLIV